MATVYNHSSEVLIENLVRHEDPEFLFFYEKRFNQTEVREWMQTFCHASVGISFLYLILIFSLKLHMNNRPAYELRGALALWNFILATFSIVGTWRALPTLINRIRILGLERSLCEESIGQVNAFWGFLFVLSKFPELGDTVFIVLRKQKLVFLHWYHHITVLCFCWYSHKYYYPTALFFMNVNMYVHAIMYTYFFFRALRFRMPRWVSMGITFCQTFQMIVCLLLCLYSYIRSGCEKYEIIARAGILLYSSYFVLFSKLFYEAYLTSTKVKAKSH